MQKQNTNLNEKAWEAAEPEEGDAAETGGETMESLLAQQSATVDKLARLVRCASRTILTQHKNLRIRNGLADRVGAAVDFFWRQVGRSKRFGQTVHQKRQGLGCPLPKQVQR